jgi:peptidoglycan/xylan/chitin deacetylase (PgdA/CDA1 family)
VVLTFDDGYEDNYTVVFPLLRRYGFTASFFIVTSTVGTKDHLSAAQIHEMARAGMEIESHGQHHLDFTRFSIPTARAELRRSREIIAGWTGHPVSFFAYPAGRYSTSLERLLGELGYRGALTEVPGFVTLQSNPYALERIRVAHDDTLRTFAQKLRLPVP